MSKRYSKLVGDHGAAIPSVLQVSEYFLSRAPEVVKLYKSMDIRHAYIPRRKRRRVKSYKPYFHRPKARKSKQFFPRPISRRTRRLRRLFLESVEKKRLPVTHVWHAKRFKMEELWNMRLPVNVNDKGEKAVVRAGKNGCVVHDRSYLDCWRLGMFDVEALELAGFGGGIGNAKVASGEYCCYGMICVDGLVIAPYQLIVKDGFVEIWTHPSARVECSSLMEKLGGKLVIDAVRFEVLGARSLEMVNKVMHVTIEETQSVPGRIIKMNGLSVITRTGGKLVDIFIDDGNAAFVLWMDFYRAGLSAIGVNDRHQWMVVEYEVPDFPFDMPCSRAGARHAASLAKGILEKDQARPNQCKMNTTSVESPFFPDWTLVGASMRVPLQSELMHVVVKPSLKGSIKMNAHVYSGDMVVGFVTSCCNRSNRVAIASIVASTKLGGGFRFTNPGCSHKYVAEVQLCSRNHSESAFLGLRMNS